MTFKQKALEALRQMELPSKSGIKFELVDQHNQTIRDCISRIEAIEEDDNDGINIDEALMKELMPVSVVRMNPPNQCTWKASKDYSQYYASTPNDALR